MQTSLNNKKDEKEADCSQCKYVTNFRKLTLWSHLVIREIPFKILNALWFSNYNGAVQ